MVITFSQIFTQAHLERLICQQCAAHQVATPKRRHVEVQY